LKKRWAAAVAIVIFIILSAQAYAQCQKPMNRKAYTTDRVFCGGTFILPGGISIDRDNVVIDCNHAVIKGNNFEGVGITIKNRNNVVIKNCKIANYAVGVFIQDSKGILLYDSTLMRNKLGMRLYQVSDSTFDENMDISLDRVLRMIDSQNNTISFTNKNIEEDFCRYNQCNIKGSFELQENEIEEKSTLLNALKSAIQEWIFS